MKCQYCGFYVDMPFKCPFCGGYFCADHRLPETHMCRKFKREARICNKSFKGDYGVNIPSHEASARKILSKISGAFYRLSSPSEAIHFGLAVLMVMLVGVSAAVSGSLNPSLTGLLAFVFALAFILHELCHKITARHYGLWAEFRLSLLGVIVTLISAFIPAVKIVSPGAVLVSGEANRRIIGKIALSGPIINMLLAILFLMLQYSTEDGFLGTIYIWGFIVNAYITFFNLIPFSTLDGTKIFWWNKYIWMMAFTTSIILIATTSIFTLY